MPRPRPNIVFYLAAEVHRLLQTELTRSRFQGRRVMERVAAGVMLALSHKKRLRDGLLFRDFDRDSDSLWLLPVGAEATGEPDAQPDTESDSDGPRGQRSQGQAPGADRIFEPALTYVALVLSRRLALANNLKEKPTNMHVLLGLLAAHGPAGQGWPQLRVARAGQAPVPSQAQVPVPGYFAGVARILAEQVQRLGAGYGAISADRRAAHGPIWLCLPDCAAELAEELTLWDCCTAVPVPIERDLDKDSLDQLVRVLESLNESYGLLRSCGLDPEHWYNDEGLSVSKLHDLQALRRAVQAILADPKAAAEDLSVPAAFERAFDDLKGAAKKFAGFARFDDFAHSPLGEQMMHRGQRSFEAPLAGDGEGEPLTLSDLAAEPERDQDPDPDTGQSRTGPELDLDHEAIGAYNIAHCPGIQANPTLAWFAQAVVLDGRLIHGTEGVLADPEFRRLVDTSGSYPATDDEALLNAIRADLSDAIHRCKDRLRTA